MSPPEYIQVLTTEAAIRELHSYDERRQRPTG